jgi:hypothetical protein
MREKHRQVSTPIASSPAALNDCTDTAAAVSTHHLLVAARFDFVEDTTTVFSSIHQPVFTLFDNGGGIGDGDDRSYIGGLPGRSYDGKQGDVSVKEGFVSFLWRP